MTSGSRPRVCIVGSGPGGGIAGIELAKSGMVDVTFIDTDQFGRSYSQRGERRLECISTGASFNLQATRAFGFGGTSNLWHGVVTELDDEDWALMDAAIGTPLSKEVRPYYERVAPYFAYAPEPRGRSRAPSRGKLNRALSRSNRFIAKDFLIQLHPLRLRPRLEELARTSPNVTIVDEAVALRLESSADRPGTVKSVLVNQRGTVRSVEADCVIVATGGLETPRLFLQSAESGLPIDTAFCGANLMDHPWAVLGEIHSDAGPVWLGASDVFAGRGMRRRTAYRLRSTSATPRVGTNHCFAIKPLFVGEYNEFKEAMKAIIATQLTPGSAFRLLRHYGTSKVTSGLLQLAFEKFGFGVFVRTALVFCYLEQPRRIESRVSLSSRIDEYGRRIPVIDWVLGVEELRAMDTIAVEIQDALTGTPFTFRRNAADLATLSSGAHHAGTMQIGRSASEGMIDTDLRVFGLDNVFVGDLSIFPNYGNANPTLTLGAFAARLADHVAGMTRHVPAPPRQLDAER